MLDVLDLQRPWTQIQILSLYGTCENRRSHIETPFLFFLVLKCHKGLKIRLCLALCKCSCMDTQSYLISVSLGYTHIQTYIHIYTYIYILVSLPHSFTLNHSQNQNKHCFQESQSVNHGTQTSALSGPVMIYRLDNQLHTYAHVTSRHDSR